MNRESAIIIIGLHLLQIKVVRSNNYSITVKIFLFAGQEAHFIFQH